jgi:hypothetical protein
MGLQPKAWRHVRTYLEKQFPKHTKASKQVLDAIAEFRSKNAVQDLIFKRSFLYVPTEALMQLLVIKAAL